MGNFLHKVDILRQLFGPLSNSPLASNKHAAEEKTASVVDSLEDLESQLSHCKAAVTYLERKVRCGEGIVTLHAAVPNPFFLNKSNNNF